MGVGGHADVDQDHQLAGARKHRALLHGALSGASRLALPQRAAQPGGGGVLAAPALSAGAGAGGLLGGLRGFRRSLGFRGLLRIAG